MSVHVADNSSRDLSKSDAFRRAKPQVLRQGKAIISKVINDRGAHSLIEQILIGP